MTVTAWAGNQAIEAGPVKYNIASKGYTRVYIDGARYSAHRIIFILINKKWPSKELDHKSTDKINAIDNLREATFGQNQRNRNRFSNNTSGYKGVSWVKSRRKWRAQIDYDGTRYHLGYFDSKILAAKSYAKFAKKMHKEFMRL